MQNDGNLVLYDSNNEPTWATNTVLEVITDTLGSQDEEEKLWNGEFLRSNNQNFFARVQDDGNFVLYKDRNFAAENSIWSSNTYGKGSAPFYLRTQTDGNLVLYDAHNTATWSSNTWNKGSAPFKLIMQDDGNLVLYDAHNTPTWATNTNS